MLDARQGVFVLYGGKSSAHVCASDLIRGSLNAKYPGGINAQKEMLEKEGHTVIQRGRTNIRYYVKDYLNFIHEL